MTGQIPPKRPPPPRPKYRQRTIFRHGPEQFQQALDECIDNGWTIEQIVVNSKSNIWMALASKME